MTISRTLLISIVLILSGTIRAQESATSLARKLQEQFLSAPAVSFSFDLPTEGRIAILVDLSKHRVRLESPKMLIVSDGKSIWNYDKATNRETIDNVAQGSAFHDPSGLFRFADDYAPKITAEHNSTNYTLELTPNADLQSLLSQAGGMETLTLDLKMIKDKVKILSASTASAHGTASIKHVKIITLKSVSPKSFDLKTTATTKIIDLRE